MSAVKLHVLAHQQGSEENSPFTVETEVLVLGLELIGHATPNPMLLHSQDQRQTTPFS